MGGLHRRRRAIIVALVLSVLAVPATANATHEEPAAVIAAVPGSVVATYATPVMTVKAGAPITFVNGDVPVHDIKAVDKGPDDESWCGSYEEGKCPLFWTPYVSLGKNSPVFGTDNLKPGETYEFYCTLHPWMRGTLVTV